MFFERDICQLFKCSLSFIQQSMYATMSHALNVEHVYFRFRHREQSQKLTCFETQWATKNETCCEPAVEAMITPALIACFEAAALSPISAANRIETDPTAWSLFALAWQVI